MGFGGVERDVWWLVRMTDLSKLEWEIRLQIKKYNKPIRKFRVYQSFTISAL